MALDLNRAMIIGNLTRDPEVRNTTTGQTVATFGVATNRTYTDSSGTKQEKTEFHSVVAWGKLAEICGAYLAKGRRVYVEGRLQTREWTDQEGNKRFRTEIVCENMIILDRPSGAGPRPQAAATESAPQTAPQPMESESAPEAEIRIEDIPF